MDRAMTDRLIFVGTQGSGPDQGIVAVRLDEAGPTLETLGLAAAAERPTWLLRDPRKAVIYAVSEVGNAGDREGAVLSFAHDGRSGALHPISGTSTGGGGATHLTLLSDASALFVANFGGGQAAVVPVAPDGTLLPLAALQPGAGTGPHRRQQSPHPHGVTLDPGERFLLVPDMGADRIFIYIYDKARQALIRAEPWYAQLPPGSGPRLLLFGKDGRFAYLLTELSAELYVFSWDARAGRLTPAGQLSLDQPGTEGAPSAAALILSPCGRHLYASNRLTNAIQVYAIDQASGMLTHVQSLPSEGSRPWDIQISRDGRWLVVANQGSDSIALFAVAEDGRLSSTGASLAIPAPTCTIFACGAGQGGAS